MNQPNTSRRQFLQGASALSAAAAAGYWTSPRPGLSFQSPNERPTIGFIGTGDRWNGVMGGALKYADAVIACDVDANHAEKGRVKTKEVQGKRGVNRDVDVVEDYRKVLDRKDISAVVIITPDHWHSKIAIEAMQAGKDVYCEKPLTLTVDEGKKIISVLDKTKRVFQVGTQQRSEMGQMFLKAVALVHAGRIGKVERVECRIGGSQKGGPFKKEAPPKELNYDMWLGQAPKVDYIKERVHYQFRWWYEYSGGKMTDWGAHHVDIAQWAIGQDRTGPVSVEGTAVHPCEYKDGYPVQDDIYNAALSFKINVKFPNGVDMLIRNDEDNGVLLEGTEGRIFVNRGKLVGAAVDELKTKPLPEDALVKLYKGKQPGDHMKNFFECTVDRTQPISDVYTHHRAMSTCHLANIAIRLGKKLQYDPQKEQIVGDEAANHWLSREQRKGYEINV